MTKFEPVGPSPDPAARAGFTPCSEEDDVARQLLRPAFVADHERLLLVGFDTFERLTGLERIDDGAAAHCMIAPACWRRLLGDGARHVLMAHNHPSDEARPSRADIECTRDAAAFLAVLGVDLIDHLIFVDDGHFSFRRAGLL